MLLASIVRVGWFYGLSVTHKGQRIKILMVVAGAAHDTGRSVCFLLTTRRRLPCPDRCLPFRYFLVEKVREASILGILVGTLGTAGYADVVAALRRLAADAGDLSWPGRRAGGRVGHCSSSGGMCSPMHGCAMR